MPKKREPYFNHYNNIYIWKEEAQVKAVQFSPKPKHAKETCIIPLFPIHLAT